MGGSKTASFNVSQYEWACVYAMGGFKVFPCKGKIPATSNGFKAATTDLKQIGEWWGQDRSYDIGIATGNGLMVVDVDNVEEVTKNVMDLLLSSTTYIVETKKGLHFYFKTDKLIKNSVKAIPGIDLRGEGGFVIAPQSRHMSGHVYRWREGQKGDIDVASLPHLPDELHKLLCPETKQSTNAQNNLILDTTGRKLVPTGGRNNYLTKIAGALQRKGLSYEALEAALQAENEAKLEEPLGEEEVRRIAKSVSRYNPESPIFSGLETNGAGSPESSILVRASQLSQASILYLQDKDKVKGQPTLIEGLDKMLGGGKRLGEVTCWHAEAKTGKNTLWHYLMYLSLELGIPQAYASRELSPEEEVIPNLMSVAFKENAWLSDMTNDRQEKYKGKLNEWPLFFSQGYGYFPLDAIKEWLDMGVKAGIQYFWFDHLHYMLEDPEDHKAASKLIKEIKTLAKQLKIHVDIIIQPNKLADGQKLSLNSIKGGAAMGQAIDNLLILERVRNSLGAKHITKLTLDVARSKLARVGSIYLQFDPDTTMFGETEPEEDKPVEASQPHGPTQPMYQNGYGSFNARERYNAFGNKGDNF